MYCRQCKYDLRGQVEFRCPECGTTFDPQDPQTWLSEIPSLRIRILRHFLKPPVRLIACILWAFALAAFYLPYSGPYPSPAPMPPQIRAMRVIYDTWQKQVTAHPEHADFDLEFAKAHSYPYINAKSEDPLRGKLYRWENNLENLSLLALWLMLWCPIPILLTKRKLRIAFVGLLIASVLTFGGLPFFHGVILRTGIPFTYRFFDDYAYVNGLNWSAERSQQENIVIAYERVSSYPKCREVLLMNGVPTFVNESCLHKILTLQREGKPVSIEMHVCGTGLNCD